MRLIQLLCAVCGSNLAGLTLLYVLPCVAAVVSRPAWRMLVLLIARYDSNLINEHYYIIIIIIMCPRVVTPLLRGSRKCRTGNDDDDRV